MPNVSDNTIGQGYDLRLEVKCRPVKCRKSETRFSIGRIISGESLSISSKGLVFTTAETFLPGQVVEASIDWPILLDERVRLTLVVEGTVVGSADNHTTMRIDRYQFRTRGYSESICVSGSSPARLI
jgi:hypothetical protein